MSSRTKVCTGWCAPTIIYAILASVSAVISLIHPDLKTIQERVVVFLAHVITGLLWTGILFLLCSYCYEGWAWILLIIPFIIAFVMLIFVAVIALSVLRNKTGGAVHAVATKERMRNYNQPVYGSNSAPVPGSVYPDMVLNLGALKPDPAGPTHAKSVCDFAARPSKFDILTKKQMQSPGSFLVPPGGYNYSSYDADTPSGCHEGYPPNPITKYAMPSDITRVK